MKKKMTDGKFTDDKFMGFESRQGLRSSLRERSFLEISEKHSQNLRKGRRRIARAWAKRDYRLIMAGKKPQWT